MTPTKTNILNRTGLTEHQYTDLIFKTKLLLFSELAPTAQHLQLWLINQPINKWFMCEIDKFNDEFIKDTIPFIPLDEKDVEKHYRRDINRIARNYPSALMDNVKFKKQEDFLYWNFSTN